MPQWLLISLGTIAGLLIVGSALVWASRPRPRTAKSWFAPPTGTFGDPTPGGSTWLGDDGSGGGDSHHG